MFERFAREKGGDPVDPRFWYSLGVSELSNVIICFFVSIFFLSSLFYFSFDLYFFLFVLFLSDYFYRT